MTTRLANIRSFWRALLALLILAFAAQTRAAEPPVNARPKTDPVANGISCIVVVMKGIV